MKTNREERAWSRRRIKQPPNKRINDDGIPQREEVSTSQQPVVFRHEPPQTEDDTFPMMMMQVAQAEAKTASASSRIPRLET